jgi:hypothetical protein
MDIQIYTDLQISMDMQTMTLICKFLQITAETSQDNQYYSTEVKSAISHNVNHSPFKNDGNP